MELYKQLLLNAYAQLSVMDNAAEYLSLMETIEALQKKMDDLQEGKNAAFVATWIIQTQMDINEGLIK